MVSLCMIVREEEAVLARCLESIADCVEEIIIVDTGSSDRTKEIAAGFTDKIYDFPWTDDFAAARNFAFSKATEEYLLWLDADDIFPETEKRKFFDLKERLQKDPCDVVMMVYDAGFDEAGRAVVSYERERLIRNCPQAKWQGRVHEVIVPFGRIWHEEIHFLHRKEKKTDTDRNLRIYEKMLSAGENLEPRAKFYYGRECFYHGKWEQAEQIFREFLEEEAGWLENKLEAVRFLAASLREMGRAEEAFSVLLEGLRLAPPTGEHCCEIGQYFVEQEAWEQAIFWYENALRAEKRTEKGAFVQEECYGYLPCIQLCVCYDRLGDRERAKLYNEMAGVLKPQDAAVEWNRTYFSAK